MKLTQKTIISGALASMLAGAGGALAAGGNSSALSTEPTPYLGDDELPPRTAPLIEWGGDFLGTGNLDPGFEIFTGAVWQPRLWVYGNYRTAAQTYDPGDGADTVSEWVNRMDLFANLQLTGTERVVLGVSPLHRDRSFTGYIDDGTDSEWNDELNADITVLFFEGDFAELFPGSDPNDSKKNDIGFSIGRQQILFQDGFMINDRMDGFGLSKNNLTIPEAAWLTNYRISGFYAWNEIHRPGMLSKDDGDLFAVFNQIETLRNTMNIDLGWVSSDNGHGDLFGWAIDSTQRFGLINTTFRLAGSVADEVTEFADDGTIAFAEISWTPHGSHNLVYINGFAGWDRYTQLVRDPLAGGPLGRTGLSYAARGIGSYPSALSGDVEDSIGLAVGYQIFMGPPYAARRQLVLEAGARFADETDTRDSEDEYAVSARFQQALGHRFVLQIEGFLAETDAAGTRSGFRTELLTKF